MSNLWNRKSIQSGYMSHTMKHFQTSRKKHAISVEEVRSGIKGDGSYHMGPVRSEVTQKVEAGNHSKKTASVTDSKSVQPLSVSLPLPLGINTNAPLVMWREVVLKIEGIKGVVCGLVKSLVSHSTESSFSVLTWPGRWIRRA